MSRAHRIAMAHRFVRFAHRLHVARLTPHDLDATDMRWGIDRREVTGRGTWPAPGHLRGFTLDDEDAA